MPTILFLNKAPPYQNTGAEKVIFDIGKKLAREQWDVHYLTPFNRERPPNIQNITFHEVKTPDSFFAGKMLFFIRGIPRYLEVRDTIEPDIVYDNPSPFPFPYAHLVDRDSTVAKVHAIYGRRAFRNKHHPITKVGTIAGEQLYRLMDGSRLLTISQSTREHLGDLVRKNGDRITVVESGIDVDNFDFEFSPDGPVVTLCELTPRKNISLLLRAWKRIESRSTTNRPLIIAGDGPRREALEDLSVELSLTNVTFRGYISEDRKRDLLREAFCYVLPTNMEGFGMTNIEAMASGCVVVSTDTLGVRDYLRDGVNGYLIPPGGRDELSRKLKTVLVHPGEQEPMAEKARETAEEYDLENTVAKEHEIMKQILNAFRTADSA
jgi:glycosyltransferase involved in cell wall biosynthesis